MIVAAGLLVLGGLGLFVAGVFTDVTALYWACVGVCVLAAVLLYLVRRRLRAPGAAAPLAPGTAPAGARSGRHAGGTAGPANPPAAAERQGGAAVPEATPATGADGPALPPDPGGTDVPDAAPAEEPASAAATSTVPAAGATAAGATAVGAMAVPIPAGTTEPGEPPVEEVEVTDLLLVVDLRDEVLVVDEHPRYHVAGCRHLAGQETIPIPLDEARTDGFTPCGTCRPDATLADRVRARK